MTVEADGLGLADALELLRAELAAAQEKALGHDLQFPIQTLTVELKLRVTRSKEGKAGFRSVFGGRVRASAGRDREDVQTVTLVLGAPVDDDGRPVRIARRSHDKP